MLAYRNSPLWQCYERCSNVLSSFGRHGWLELDQQRGHRVTCALIGMSCLQLYEQSARVSKRSEKDLLPGVRLPLEMNQN